MSYIGDKDSLNSIAPEARATLVDSITGRNILFNLLTLPSVQRFSPQRFDTFLATNSDTLETSDIIIINSADFLSFFDALAKTTKTSDT